MTTSLEWQRRKKESYRILIPEHILWGMTHTDLRARSAAPRRRNPEATKERLVTSALELFTTLGYHASTTPQIAAKAGVAEGTIYRHFSGKSHMFNEIYRGALRIYAKPLDEGKTITNCKQKLEVLAERWFDLTRRNRHLAYLVFVMPVEKLLDDESRNIRIEFHALLISIMASGKSDGVVRSGSAEVWADVWLQLVALAVNKLASGVWTGDKGYLTQVVDAAWQAVSVNSSR